MRENASDWYLNKGEEWVNSAENSPWQLGEF